MTAAAIDPTTILWRRGGLTYRARHDRHGTLIFRARIRGIRDLVVWASGKSNYLISKLLNQLFNATSYTFPSTIYAALWTSSLTASSTGSSSGEAAYTGYARVSVTANNTNFSTSSTGSATTNSVAITFPANGGAGTSTVTYIALLDASSTGNILYWGSVTSTTINQGDTPQINASALTVTEA